MYQGAIEHTLSLSGCAVRGLGGNLLVRSDRMNDFAETRDRLERTAAGKNVLQSGEKLLRHLGSYILSYFKIVQTTFVGGMHPMDIRNLPLNFLDLWLVCRAAWARTSSRLEALGQHNASAKHPKIAATVHKHCVEQ